MRSRLTCRWPKGSTHMKTSLIVLIEQEPQWLLFSSLPPSFSSTNLTTYSFFHCLKLIPCCSIYSSQHFVGYHSYFTNEEYTALQQIGGCITVKAHHRWGLSVCMFLWAWTSAQQVSQAWHDLDDIKREKKKKTSSCREIHLSTPQILPLLSLSHIAPGLSSGFWCGLAVLSFLIIWFNWKCSYQLCYISLAA